MTTSNSIKLSIALNGRQTTSPLLFVQGDGSKFMALEMVSGRIRFVWNLGGSVVGDITHSLRIEQRDPKYDDAWYHIEVTRTMNLCSLMVMRMNQYGLLVESSDAVRAATSGDHTQFNVGVNDRIWIGGVPADIRPAELNGGTASVGLAVVMHQLYFDGEQIALWHFAHSQGECGGAMLGAQVTTATASTRHFNGHGYAAVSKARSRPYKKSVFYMQMTFKTLDENALLFLAVDEKNVSFFFAVWIN